MEFGKNWKLEEKIDVTKLSKDTLESAAIAAYGLSETVNMYENFAIGFDSFEFTTDNVENRIDEMDEAYVLAIQEVDKLFKGVTEEL